MEGAAEEGAAGHGHSDGGLSSAQAGRSRGNPARLPPGKSPAKLDALSHWPGSLKPRPGSHWSKEPNRPRLLRFPARKPAPRNSSLRMRSGVLALEVAMAERMRSTKPTAQAHRTLESAQAQLGGVVEGKAGGEPIARLFRASSAAPGGSTQALDGFGHQILPGRCGLRGAGAGRQLGPHGAGQG